MEAETKAADDGRPLGRRTSSTAQEQLPRHQYGQTRHSASSRYMSFRSKKPRPPDSSASVTPDTLRPLIERKRSSRE